MVAEHNSAFNYDTGKKKKVYYLEGTNYEMGYLLGLLAEDEISLISTKYASKMVLEFIKNAISKRSNLLQEVLVSLLSSIGKKYFSELPVEIRNEIKGLYDGCKKSNPKTKVDLKHLYTLNAGIDILCSIVYTGFFLFNKIPGVKPQEFKIPVMCNGFSVFGRHTAGEHYFGRDFMFPTANVFQNTAAMIIYNPVGSQGKETYPFVSVTSPGIVGSLSAANINGLGIGVNMSPGMNCNPNKIGVNSILLTRMCAQFGKSAEHAVEIMERTPRGVSWNYIIADGKNDCSCIVEAGNSNEDPEFFKYISDDLKKHLPLEEYINANPSTTYRNGLMVRWNDYEYPVDYLNYNYSLLKYYNERNKENKKFDPYYDSIKGYINSKPSDKNCPSTYYFAPQREDSRNIVVTTNHYIIPEMRLYSMYPWTSQIVGDIINDIQWRYDELNNQILTHLDEYQYIDFIAAKDLIDFLSPHGKYPWYYADNPKSADGKEVRIEGCTSIFDLKRGIVDSHYGYYCDEWIRLTLPNYV